MAVTGWKDPSSNSVYSSGSGSWSNATNVYTANTSYATVSVSGNSDHQLWAGYGFTTSDIPSGATIDGIEVQAYNYSVDSPGNGSEVYAQLHAGATTLGAAKSPTTPGFSNTIDELGGATDMWGTSLTDSDIRGSDFGVVYYADNAVSDTAYLGGLRVRVYYTELTQDVLTASDVSSLSQVDSGSLGQTHGLTSSDVTSSTTLATPTFGQAHVLSGVDLESLASVDVPIIVVDNQNALVSSSVETTSNVGSPSVGQAHVLAPTGVDTATSVGTPVLSTADVLVSSGVYAATTVGSASLVETYVFTGTSTEALTYLTKPVLFRGEIIGDNTAAVRPESRVVSIGEHW